MTTTIDQMVTSSLQTAGLGGYASRAEPITRALIEREQELAGDIIAFAVGKGLTSDQARDALAGLGMHVPGLSSVGTGTMINPRAGTVASATSQNDADGTEDSVAMMLARIDARLNDLTSFARENGYQGI